MGARYCETKRNGCKVTTSFYGMPPVTEVSHICKSKKWLFRRNRWFRNMLAAPDYSKLSYKYL